MVCVDYLTIYTTTSASNVHSPRSGMECAWESDTPLNALLITLIAGTIDKGRGGIGNSKYFLLDPHFGDVTTLPLFLIMGGIILRKWLKLELEKLSKRS